MAALLNRMKDAGSKAEPLVADYTDKEAIIRPASDDLKK